MDGRSERFARRPRSVEFCVADSRTGYAPQRHDSGCVQSRLVVDVEGSSFGIRHDLQRRLGRKHRRRDIPAIPRRRRRQRNSGAAGLRGAPPDGEVEGRGAVRVGVAQAQRNPLVLPPRQPQGPERGAVRQSVPQLLVCRDRLRYEASVASVEPVEPPRQVQPTEHTRAEGVDDVVIRHAWLRIGPLAACSGSTSIGAAAATGA
jgi:hypothetical protein